MNYRDPIIGGGIASLMDRGHGDVSQPGAFEFAQKSEPVVRMARGGMTGEDMFYEEEPFDFGFAPAAAPAPTPAPTTAPPPQDYFIQPFQPDAPVLDPYTVAAPAPMATPAPAPVASTPPAPIEQPQGPGHWAAGGMQGEDYMEPQWIPDPSPLVPGKDYDPQNYFTSSFNWAKHGWTGGDPGVYSTMEGGGESGNQTAREQIGVTPEFSKWLQSQGIQVVDQSRGANADLYLVKDGQIIDHYHHEPAWIDKAAPLLVAAGLATLNPALAGSLGGGLAGAAGAGAITGGLTSGAFGGDILKGALTGGIGGAASSFLGPAAGSVGQSVSEATGSKLLGDIASGAVRGAGQSGFGAALRGDSITDALLSGAISGGVGSGVTSTVGQTGLPSYVTSPASAAITAAILGKDPQTAAMNALIGQLMSGGGAKTTDTGDETQRLMSRYGTSGEEQITEEEQAPDLGLLPEKKTADITDEDIAQLVSGVSPDDIGSLLESVGQDTIGRTQTEAGELAGAKDWYDQQYGMDDWGIESGNLSDQEAAQDALDAITGGRGNLEQDYAVTDTGKILDTSTGQTGVFEDGQWSPDYDIGSLGKLGDVDQTVEVIGGKGGQDTIDAKLNPFDLDYEATLDEFNKYVDEQNQKRQDDIDLGEGLDTLIGGGGGDKATKGGGGGGAKSRTVGSKSGTDWASLFALLSMMGGDQQQGSVSPPELFKSNTDLKKIFGNYFA